jgi:hypothetical protein
LLEELGFIAHVVGQDEEYQRKYAEVSFLSEEQKVERSDYLHHVPGCTGQADLPGDVA